MRRHSYPPELGLSEAVNCSIVEANLLTLSENKARLKGLINIALTPFTIEGAVDEKGFVENLERMVALGYDGILVGGTYGEFGTMSVEERASLFRLTMKVVGQRVPVLLCVAGSDLRVIRELTVLARDLSGLPMALPPLVSDTTDDQLVGYFDMLAALSTTGLVIYNAPRVSTNLSLGLIQKLAEMRNVIGIKQGDLSLNGMDDLANKLGGQIRLICASDLAFLGPMMSGFDGVSSTNSCAFPELIKQIYSSLELGDARLAQELHSAWHPFRLLARRYGQPQTTKAAMNLRGFAGGSVRLPLLDLDDMQRAEVLDVIDAVRTTLGQPRYSSMQA